MNRPASVKQKPKNSHTHRAAQLKAVSQALHVYRPQPVPKVLQTKTSPQSNSARGRLAQPSQVVQNKAKPGTAPPVYRPNPTPVVLQMKIGRLSNNLARPLMIPVIQRAEGGGQSSSNVHVYGSLAQHYGEEKVAAAEAKALKGRKVRGHRSRPGGGDAGVHPQTQADVAAVTAVLRQDEARAQQARKPQAQQRGPMSGYGKAEAQADRILADRGVDGLGDFVEYLETRRETLGLTEEEEAELIAKFSS